MHCEQSKADIVCDICGRAFSTRKSLSNHRRYHDDAYKQRMSDAQKDRQFSDATRARMSESAKRRKDTEETRRRKSEAIKARWAQPGYKEMYSERNTGKRHLPQWHKDILSKAALERWSDEEFREKLKSIYVERYGVDNPWKAESIIQRMRVNRLEAKGYSKEVLDTLLDKAKFSSLLEQNDGNAYKVANALGVQACDAFSCVRVFNLYDMLSKSMSGAEQHWQAMFDELGMQFDSQVKLYGDRRKCDFANKDFRIGIEVNPAYTHATFSNSIYGNKDSRYHLQRTLDAKANGWSLFHVWDWQDEQKVLSMIRSKLHMDKHKVSAHKCKVVQLRKSDADKFLEANHLQGTLRYGQKVMLGLMYNDEIVQVATYGTPRYNSKHDWEWLRACTKQNWQVQGGMSKLHNFFVSNWQPHSIMTYTDYSHASGEFNLSLGYEFDGLTSPALVWYNYDKVVRDTLLLKVGADSVLGTHYGPREECGMDNHDIMLAEGFMGVYDCGNARYIWREA